MRYLDAAALRDHLPYPALVAALREMLALAERGATIAPRRMVVPLPGDASLLVMPASDGTIAITKLVTVHPANPAAGRASVQADVLVLDAITGERLLLLDGELITGRRTAALSVLAAQILAPHNRGPLLIVGAGTQALAHLEAFAASGAVAQVFIASRTLAHAEALARHGQRLGIECRAVADQASVLDRATMIVTATTSSEPVLPVGVRTDAFIAAVGAYRADMAELPAALVRQSACYVDTAEGARAEAGDLLRAGVDWAAVRPLQAVLDLPPPTGRPIIFKSVGQALWDLAAVRVVLASLGVAQQP
jgi:ornithine cyclodeaminase